ncbi:DedA family protein [Ornithinimicrobium sp. W1679]|uniref:DedA family protein n=1 Tax=unclassified Ornithinimicrobium TaxID=2615080 RepID=UPI003CF8640A
MGTVTASQGQFFWEGHGFLVAYLFLFAVAMLRGQATYWLARVVTEQTLRRTRPTEGWKAGVHRWLRGDGVARGRSSIQRWGLVTIPLAYLTVGFQTMVLAAAGMLRIAWPVFTLVQVPGALAWAGIYSTIGFALWGATIAAMAGQPLALAALLALVVVVGTTLAVRRRRRDATPAVAEDRRTPLS